MNKAETQMMSGNIRRIPRPINPVYKRSVSSSPPPRAMNPNTIGERRCQSLSPSKYSRKSLERTLPQSSASAPATTKLSKYISLIKKQSEQISEQVSEQDVVIPQCMVTKMLRALSAKKREFIKMQKNVIAQQNLMLESYASIKEMEVRAGKSANNGTEPVGDVKVLSVTNWPAHDLALLVRDDFKISDSKISGVIGPQILQRIRAQLDNIPDDVLNLSNEILGRRMDIINVLRGKCSRTLSNAEYKMKNTELDEETEKINKMVEELSENLRAKINQTFDIIKIPWLDRDTLIKKIERLQKENSLLHAKFDDLALNLSAKNENDVDKESDYKAVYKAVCEELAKERSARHVLKEVVGSTENMLKVDRAHITTLERLLKESRAEVDASKRKQKDLEQLYRHRECSCEGRARKLKEVSKSGEMTIETLFRQRDALELRVKELHDQMEIAEHLTVTREVEQNSRINSLIAKLAEQEKSRAEAESRVSELESRVKELSEQLKIIRERTIRMVDTEKNRSLVYLPMRGDLNSSKETEIWRELQVTKDALSKAEKALCQCQADKENFLNSLSRIAQGDGAENLHDKIVIELLDSEKNAGKLQHIIDELRQSERDKEETIAQFETQLEALRIELQRLQNYDCFAKDITFQGLQTQPFEINGFRRFERK